MRTTDDRKGILMTFLLKFIKWYETVVGGV
jgi:hypothetical protein